MINLRDKGAELWEGWNRPKRIAFAIAAIVVVALLPSAAGFGPTSFLNTPITSFENVLVYPIGMFALMALGLNIVVGKSGLLDLGYVAFFAIGAYSQALMSTILGWNTWEILPFGIAFAMCSGLLLGLPALRLRGDYLAIVTLGFGEIVRIIALNIKATGGPNGIAKIPNPPTIDEVREAILTAVNLKESPQKSVEHLTWDRLANIVMHDARSIISSGISVIEHE